jgi:hypothetical protein
LLDLAETYERAAVSLVCAAASMSTLLLKGEEAAIGGTETNTAGCRHQRERRHNRRICRPS